MNIATALTSDDRVRVESRVETCRIVPFQARRTYALYRDGLLCGSLNCTKAAALNRIVALTNRHPEHRWDVA